MLFSILKVVTLILDGVLLCPPSDCPPQICSIMEGCWKTEPKDRLKFPQIVQKLRELPHPQPPQTHIRNLNQSLAAAVKFEGYEIPSHILQMQQKVDYLQVI